jgi:hypothetical protein
VGTRLRPNVPLRRTVIEVTGIADPASPLGGTQTGSKEVQFRWEYAGADEVTMRFIVRGGTGRALMRLFDDGWRIDHIELQELSEGFPLSAAAQAAAESDRRSETERRLAEENLISQARQIGAAVFECGPVKDFSGYRSQKFSVMQDGLSGVNALQGRSTNEAFFIDLRYFMKIDNGYLGDQNLEIWVSADEYHPGGSSPLRFIGPQGTANRDACYEAIRVSYENWRSRFPTLAKLPSLR